ncbi:hypothetical protein F4Y59_13655 [Candidatus Poribacteria bacterium]|nr:hypothetical protein [Candidatus Poribacteria bacterium]MYK17150.1 hypothetical protein [Candidatus Poribacteria bacterium]
MKTVLLLAIVFSAIAFPASAELTVEDLDKIRSIIKEEIADEIAPLKVEIGSIKTEITAMKTEIASMKTEITAVKENVASLNGRVNGIEKMMTWLLAVIAVVLGIPQIIVAWRSRKDSEQEKRIEELSREIETLKQQIVNP